MNLGQCGLKNFIVLYRDTHCEGIKTLLTSCYRLKTLSIGVDDADMGFIDLRIS